MTLNPITVLVVEDNPGDADLLESYLEAAQENRFSLARTETLAAAQQYLQHKTTDVVLLDLGLPDSQGLETFQRLHASAPDAAFVILSGLNDKALALQSMQLGAQDYLPKGDLNTSLLERTLPYALERQNNAKTLRESEEKYRHLHRRNAEALQVAHMAYWSYDVAANEYIFNDQYYALHGLSVEDVGGYRMKAERFAMQFFHPQDVARVLEIAHQASLAPKTDFQYQTEIRILRADGTPRWVTVWFRAELDERGQAAFFHGVTQDINDRKQAEAHLAERNATLNAMLESASSPVFSLDRSYRYTSFNSAHADVMRLLYGVEIELGGSLAEYQKVPEDWATAKVNIDRCLAGEHLFEAGPSGEGEARHYYEIAHNPILNLDGEIIGASVFVNDVTERKKAEERQMQYAAQLEAAVAERTRELTEMQEKLVRHERLAVLGQLAGSVGHELRNPLGVIKNAVYFLKLVQPDAPEKVKQYLEMIDSETQVADKIIGDLLDFSRIKSIDQEFVSVPELVRATLDRYPTPPEVQVTLNLPEELPAVFADPRQMQQVLGNLCVNACQAMPSGGSLQISARLEEPEGQPAVAISVRDSGDGIPPANMSRLFEPLFTTRAKGIGLGLALSQKLVQANHGRIEAQSQQGQGSTFTVYLPTQADESRP